MDANKTGVGTRGAVEDGARSNSDAIFDALEDSVEIRGLLMFEAAVHGPLRLNSDPTEFLLDDGVEDLPVGAHDVADLLQVTGVVLEVLSDISSESVLQP